MNYVKYLTFLFIYNTVITHASLSLGITNAIYEIPELDDLAGVGFLDALLIPVHYVINNGSAFLQLMSFQTGIPPFLSIIFIGSFAFSLIAVLVMVLRGI